MTIPCHPPTLLHKPVEAVVTIYRRMQHIVGHSTFCKTHAYTAQYVCIICMQQFIMSSVSHELNLNVSDCVTHIWPIPMPMVCNDILCDIPEHDPPRTYARMYARTYVLSENRSSIQSLALMRSAITRKLPTCLDNDVICQSKGSENYEKLCTPSLSLAERVVRWLALQRM